MDSKAFRRDRHNKIISYGAVYYTHNTLDEKIMTWCKEKLLVAIGDMPLVTVSLKPLDFGKNIVLNKEPGYLTMFEEILTGLEAIETDVVFLVEHDVGYPKEHFDFTPPRDDTFYYDLNWYKIGRGDLAVHWDAVQVSGLCAYRELLIEFYKERIDKFDAEGFDRKFEPTVETKFETWRASVPHIDIRHGTNTTYNKWKLEHFRDRTTAVNFESTTIDKIPGWDSGTLSSLY